jgi:triacylglycerol lipase
MQLHGEWLRRLQDDEARVAQPPFTCWYSNCDNIVFPASTAMLPGADNRHRAGVAHVAMAFRPEVMQACMELLDERIATYAR